MKHSGIPCIVRAAGPPLLVSTCFNTVFGSILALVTYEGIFTAIESNSMQFRYQLFATFQRPVLVCIECIQSFLLFVLMENGQTSSSRLDGTWSLLRFACQGSHCRDEAGGGHQEIYWELRAFGSNPVWRTVMSTAILVASFACFFLDSVCFRHCSFDGILRGACPKGDPRDPLWFPVIHYGSLSCSLRNPMVP